MTLQIEQALSNADPILAKIIQAIPKPEIWSTNDVFHDLMSCVLEQQIHYRSTKKTFQKLLDMAMLDRLTPTNFPEFEERALPTLKLASSKYETIANILTYWNSNPTNWQALSDEEVRHELSSIKGIGKWTIDMILLYTLQRPSVFPYDDYHLKQIMASAYGLDPKVRLKARMIAIAKNWGEHQSLAVRYLLAWKAFKKGL